MVYALNIGLPAMVAINLLFVGVPFNGAVAAFIAMLWVGSLVENWKRK